MLTAHRSIVLGPTVSIPALESRNGCTKTAKSTDKEQRVITVIAILCDFRESASGRTLGDRPEQSRRGTVFTYERDVRRRFCGLRADRRSANYASGSDQLAKSIARAAHRRGKTPPRITTAPGFAGDHSGPGPSQ